MLLAYRRGLLEPDYKYGIQSRIRESMILGMMAMEQNSEAIMSAIMLRCTSLAPAIEPSKAVEFANAYMGSVTRAAKLREYDTSTTDASAESALRSNSVNLVKAFNMLKERGIIEEFKQAAMKAVENLQEDDS